ncbi:hypothetical protein BB560_000620 [Smittium megazygosporum]|uniref:TLC domain-containing protein n=1 Tax=Smittium megazygosporum TaxID=133381 RepID=A0A2T9ZJW4_9FUNG|nr:hypothetical protein BB560_000620 [Smittium megazygosporum]
MFQVTEFFNDIGLPLVPPNIKPILLWAVFFILTDKVSRIFQPLLTRTPSKSLSHRAKVNWGSHVVSQIHACTLVYSVIVLMRSGSFVDPINDFTPEFFSLANFSTGFFIYDLYCCVTEFAIFGTLFFIHSIFALAGLSLVYRPMFSYFIMAGFTFEASTIFLNGVWFCDKLGYSNSIVQLFNGIGLVISFFGVRIVYGYIAFYRVLKLLFANSSTLPPFVFYSSVCIIFVSLSLNTFWFYKIIAAFSRRFSGSSKPVAEAEKKSN